MIALQKVTRSSLEILTVQKTAIFAEGRAVRLFWMRAHAGIAVNRTASLVEWQERYAEKNTDEITKCFFPRVEQAYKELQQTEMTSQITQTLTKHREFEQYLFRFKQRRIATSSFRIIV
ncbi:hypothetical protein EVAR_40021_1 [Eumeta japonica]|uniref:RNase H type-1 domain-containing protein n=1 Tax=Eumeta variegata TaxID=151549 RepID=A0A4C1YMJ5_EUMVA|nr:hypothetical protein EVAR_40021_1 [Eumeta japonica]